VQAGHFGLGSRLLGPLLVVTTALCLAIVPAAARRDVSLRRPFVIATGLTLAVLGAVAATAPLVIRLAAGPGYADAVPAVRAYTLAAAVVAIAQPLSSWLQARGDERFVGRVLPLGIVAGLVLTGTGAALGGATGGALGQAVACVAVTGLLAHRLRGLRPDAVGRPAARHRRQPERQREREVPAAGVAEGREEQVPQGHRQYERLGE
jgi:O-antigen/teichoic acid export membrane protein